MTRGEPISYSGSLAKANPDDRQPSGRCRSWCRATAAPVRVFLSPEPIPTRLFTSATPGSLSEPLAAITAEPLVCWRTLALLGRYGLAKVADDRLTVHRLTQRLVRADTPNRIDRTQSLCFAQLFPRPGRSVSMATLQ